MKQLITFSIAVIAICVVLVTLNNLTSHTSAMSHHTTYSTTYVESTRYQPPLTSPSVLVVKRNPDIGECIVAPIDFVLGIVTGVVKTVGYGTAYVAETITPDRLYPEDNWTLFHKCDNTIRLYQEGDCSCDE